MEAGQHLPVFFLRQALRLVVVLSLCAGTQTISRAVSVSLHPSANTTITQKTTAPPSTDLLVGTTGPSGGTASSRTLMQFNIAGNIPTNAVITNVTLTVDVTQAPPVQNRVNSTFDLRRVLVLWSASSATWSTPWHSSGGAIGVDFSSTISQTQFFAGEGSYTFASNSNLVADVQTWLQTPASNFGWVVISELQGTQYTERTMSSNGGTDPPTLLVQFTIPAAMPVIIPFSRTNGVFQFGFNAESNRTYTVQYIGALSGSSWSVLTNFSAAPVATNFVVSDPFTSSNRFYRVQTP
jgi:hypothetical protein